MTDARFEISLRREAPAHKRPPLPPIETLNKQIWEQKELLLAAIGGNSQREPLGQSGPGKQMLVFEDQRTSWHQSASKASVVSILRQQALFLLQTSDNLDRSLHQTGFARRVGGWGGVGGAKPSEQTSAAGNRSKPPLRHVSQIRAKGVPSRA